MYLIENAVLEIILLEKVNFSFENVHKKWNLYSYKLYL